MDKLASIILPTYNGAGRIKEAIESVLGQSYGHWELLVLDDGSTDNTDLIVKNLAENESRIIYLKNDSNLGIQKTLNKGLKIARGEYIARIDDDDVWTDKNKLKTQIEFLEQNKDYVLVGTNFIAVDEQDREIFKSNNPTEDMLIRRQILNKNCFLHSSVLFRRDAAVECGGYSESGEVKHIEDYDLWLRLGNTGKFANLANLGVKFILREGSISSKNKIQQFRNCLKLIKKYKNRYPNYKSAQVRLVARMVLYVFFQIWPLSYLYKSFYKLYKSN